DEGARQVAARLADLLAEVDRAFPAIVGLENRLEGKDRRAEEEPTSGQGKRRWLRYTTGLAEREERRHESQKREALEEGREFLNRPGPVHAAPVTCSQRDRREDRHGKLITRELRNDGGEVHRELQVDV